MHSVSLPTRLLPVLLSAALLVPGALAQEDAPDDERSRVLIRIDADSIYVERDGEKTAVPNTPEGRAQLDADDLGLDGERFDLGDFSMDLDGDARVFRFRSGGGPFGLLRGADRDGFDVELDELDLELDGPRVAIRRVGPDGFGVHAFGEGVRWTEADAEARAEIMEMEMRARSLAREARAEDDAERRADLEAELDELLGDLFERKLDQRRARVERLEAELREEQERLETREDARAEIIERRKQELLGEDALDW